MQIFDRLSLFAGRDLVLGTLMERLAGAHGSRRLVEEADGGLCLTFAEAADLVARWAGGIAERTEPGDVVVVATPNGYEQVLLMLATSRAGRLPAPVNAQMTASEIDHVVRDSGATLRITAASDVEGSDAVDAAPAAPDEIAALFYTSGTTGKPKGAELTHRGLLGGLSTAAAYPAGLRPAEIVLALPVAHIYGALMLLGAACAGMPVYFLPKFNPVRVLDAIEQRRATLFAGVPAMYRMLLEAGAKDRDLTSVRMWISGADAMPPDLAAQFKRFGATVSLPLLGSIGEAAFAEGYGMVETGGGVAVRLSPPLVPARFGGALGMPLPGYSFRVVDDEGTEVPVGSTGELLIKGPGILEGYHGDADATAAALTDDGWLRSGDLARRGLFGTVSFEGRAKDVIKRGGYSVYAVEVEHALEEHPDVLEAAVVALPDARDGEVPAAAVRLRPGVALDDVDLAGWAAERLSSYKVPSRFLAVDELPRTGTDKVQRREVVGLFDGESDEQGLDS
ncbi:MAG: Acyl-CoA synthetase (AMP-forming)/AMP-acid ligase [Acidimicrobiales bacterium]|nr:Acyl-CoA synthetase (AMP-forming)/AMP-acid ligase [Acidimicrobiales bacterium]